MRVYLSINLETSNQANYSPSYLLCILAFNLGDMYPYNSIEKILSTTLEN